MSLACKCEDSVQRIESMEELFYRELLIGMPAEVGRRYKYEYDSSS